MTKTYDIDLTPLRNKTGKLVPGTALELVIIQKYRYVVNRESNTLEDVINYIANYLTKDPDKKSDYNKILVFFKSNFFMYVIMKFLTDLEHILFKHIEPDFKDIKYVKVINTDKDNFIVRFEAEF